jgi:hypothetical protein
MESWCFCGRSLDKPHEVLASGVQILRFGEIYSNCDRSEPAFTFLNFTKKLLASNSKWSRLWQSLIALTASRNP